MKGCCTGSTPNLPEFRKTYHLQDEAAHYGVFNSSRYRTITAPRIVSFVREMHGTADAPKLRQVG